MSLKLKHTLVSLQAILAIAAVLNLGAPVACGASPAAAKAAAVPHVSWGQLKALYRGSVPEAAGSFRAGLAKPPRPATLTAVALVPSTVAGGTGSTGSVVLSVGAPPGGAIVTLSSSDPALASAPASVTIPTGAKSATFSVSTTMPVANSSAIITATFGGVSLSATLAVTAAAPPPPPAAALSSVSVAPASLSAGASSVGTASLTAAAPAGGAVVALSSANPALVGVPASVTIAAGATSATFPVTTTPSPLGAVVNITGSYLAVSLSAALTLTPTDPCASVNGLGGAAVISLSSVPQFRTGRLRVNLVGDVPAGWVNAMGGCATSAVPTVSFVSGTGTVTIAGTTTSITLPGSPLAFGPLTVPIVPPEPGVVLNIDASGNVLQIIWPALAGLPAGPPVFRMNLSAWTADAQTGVALDATMTFVARNNLDGSTATFTAHGAGMVIPTFVP